MYGRGLALLLWGLGLLISAPVQAVPEIQHWVTGQNSRVYFVPTEGIPMLDVRVMFDAGSARDGRQAGLATLTSALLDTGAGDLDADAIAQRLEGVGAILDTGVSRDAAWLSLRSLTKPEWLQTALSTLSEILARPRFDAADFEREKKRMLIALKQREESPSDLAAIAFFEMAYGDHPYAHPKDGYRETVEKLTRDDLEAFYRRLYTASNAMVVLVGGIQRTEAERIAEQLVAGLPQGEPPPPLAPVPIPQAANTVKKEFPSEQTHIYSGAPGMKFSDPDYFPLYVGNHILGGSGLVSKITEEVREKRGLSYSAFSYFYPFREAGPFLMGLQTRNDQAQEALQVLQATLRQFLNDGPSDKELEASKKNITGGFVLRLDSNRKLIEQVAAVGFYQLPLDWLDTFIPRVQAVTRDDIKRAFQARIDPNRLQTILVGATVSGREK